MLSFLKSLNGFRKKIYFDDGSSVEWRDRETLLYTKGHLLCYIWVDYFEKSFFSGGRVIHVKSINKWSDVDAMEVSEMSNDEKNQVLERIKKYYEQRGIEYRVED